MSITIDYSMIYAKLNRKISDDESTEQLTESEKNKLRELGINENDYNAYQKVLEKIGAQNEYERNVVLEELQKLIKRINELCPANASNKISAVLSEAISSVSTIEELFNRFNNVIYNLENNVDKTEDEKAFDQLIFKYQSYSNQFSADDYNQLKTIVQKSGSGFSDITETKNSKGITTLKFKDSKGKEYTISTNQIIDYTEKQNILTQLEAILKDFAEGKLPWNQLGKKLEEFGIDAETYYDNSQITDNGKTYRIKVVCQGVTYECVCNKEGANNNIQDRVEYQTFAASELKSKISDQSIIDKYFIPVVIKDDSAILYIKNEAAWSEVGADGTNDIKTLLDKIEESKKTTRAEDSDSVELSSLNDKQKQKIKDICNDIKIKIGLNDSETEELKKRLSNRIAELISNNVIVDDNFDFNVETEAIIIAADIVNDRELKSEDSIDIEDVISKIDSHSNDALTELKKAYDKGLVDVEIKKDGSEYCVTVKDKDGTVRCTEYYTKDELDKAGFTEYMEAPDSNGNISLNRAAVNGNITENDKIAQLLIICHSTMLKQVFWNDHILDDIVGLSYTQAMELFSELKEFFKDKNYNNIDTFVKDAKYKAKELGKKYVDKNTNTADNTNGSNNTGNSDGSRGSSESDGSKGSGESDGTKPKETGNKNDITSTGTIDFNADTASIEDYFSYVLRQIWSVVGGGIDLDGYMSDYKETPDGPAVGKTWDLVDGNGDSYGYIILKNDGKVILKGPAGNINVTVDNYFEWKAKQ